MAGFCEMLAGTGEVAPSWKVVFCALRTHSARPLTHRVARLAPVRSGRVGSRRRSKTVISRANLMLCIISVHAAASPSRAVRRERESVGPSPFARLARKKNAAAEMSESER